MRLDDRCKSIQAVIEHLDEISTKINEIQSRLDILERITDQHRASFDAHKEPIPRYNNDINDIF